jgi:hypothetical protein
MDVVVTDHHTPRADGRLPDAPIVHPAWRLPVPGAVRGRVAYKLAGALLRPRAATRARPTRTSTSSRWPRSPTSSRCRARTPPRPPGL